MEVWEHKNILTTTTMDLSPMMTSKEMKIAHTFDGDVHNKSNEEVKPTTKNEHCPKN